MQADGDHSGAGKPRGRCRLAQRAVAAGVLHLRPLLADGTMTGAQQAFQAQHARGISRSQARSAAAGIIASGCALQVWNSAPWSGA